MGELGRPLTGGEVVSLSLRKTTDLRRTVGEIILECNVGSEDILCAAGAQLLGCHVAREE